MFADSVLHRARILEAGAVEVPGRRGRGRKQASLGPTPCHLWDPLSEAEGSCSRLSAERAKSYTAACVLWDTSWEKSVYLFLCHTAVYYGQWNEFNSQPATGLHGLRMGDIMYMEMDWVGGCLLHFGGAKSHILARAERNPHNTLPGEEYM